MSNSNFWKSAIIKWEKTRYDSSFSKLIYSSLIYRQKLFAYLIEQIPANSTVLEIGCGTGRLYKNLTNKAQINYTGADISEEAINTARKEFPAARWICEDIKNISGFNCDYLISAGVLDWVDKKDFQNFLKNNNFKYHLHSFSQDTGSISQKIHKIYSFLLSKKSGISYKPGVFTRSEILDILNSARPISFISDPKLSFGAVAHSLPDSINADFSSFESNNYFKTKKNNISFIESIFKKSELNLIQKFGLNLNNKTILEIGSGSGEYTKWLLKQKPRLLLCIDPYVKTPDYVKINNYEFSQVSLENQNLLTTFDIILDFGVLEFVPDIQKHLQKIIDLTHIGSEIVILAPRDSGLIRFIYNYSHKMRGITLNSEIESKMTQTLKNSGIKYRIQKKDGGFLNNLFIINRDG